MSEVSFFSEADMFIDKEGNKVISSEYPVWYNRQMLEDLKEDIRMAKFEIETGRVADRNVPQARERLNKLQDKMTTIEQSLPKLEPNDVDKLAKLRKSLGNEIANRMYSRTDMQKGLADSHEEARRMVTPSIKITGDALDIAKACNVKVKNGMVSRTGTEKIWKIAGRYLGEQSNSEALRRD